MADYVSKYTGPQIDEAVGKALNGGTEAGADGFSPVANVQQTASGAVVTITDKDGTTTATITNGVDGEDGQDGVSPTITASKSGNKTTLNITDANGTKTVEINDGADGQDGTDGVSPTVEVSKSGKVTTVKITDAEGTKTATINDGADGKTPVKGTDYVDGKDGVDGRRGTGILRVTTSTTSSSGTGDTGIAIKYKIALSTVKAEAGVDAVYVGDSVLRSVYLYPVAMVDTSYVYLGNYTSIKGNPGNDGDDGQDGKDGQDAALYLTESEYDAMTAEELAAYYNDGIRLVFVEDDHENLVPKSIGENGSIYNGCGYLINNRLSSSGIVTDAQFSVLTGYIPHTPGGTIRVVGALGAPEEGGQYIAAYDSNFEPLAIVGLSSMLYYTGDNTGYTVENERVYVINTADITYDTYRTAFANAAYIRVSVTPCIGKNLKVCYL